MNILQNSTTFICFCSQKVKVSPESNLAKHIKYCQNYKQESPIAKIFLGIKLNNLDKGQLLALKHEYLNYVETLDEEITKRKNLKAPYIEKKAELKIGDGGSLKQNSPSDPPEQKFHSEIFKTPEPKKANEEKNNLNQSVFRSNIKDSFGMAFLSKAKISCQKCMKEFCDFDVDKFWYLENCVHCFCRACLSKQILQDYTKHEGQIKCVHASCKYSLTPGDIIQVIGKEKYEKLNEELLEKQLNLVKCVKCQYKFEFMKGNPEAHMKDMTGKLLTKQLAQHYADNRFVCPNSKCKVEQCLNCKAQPYHQSFTCEEWARNQESIKCRFCENPISKLDASLPKALQNICNAEECVSKSKSSCQKLLKCGHFCSGYVNELNCLPCINDECAEKNKKELLDQKGSDFCNICFVEGLINAPCIMIKCGHMFHLHCISKKLQIRWFKARITFSFCLCPLCKEWMEFPVDSPLQLKMQENLALFEEIKKKSSERLKYENMEKDPRLLNPKDPFYQKPVEYAIAIFSYYQCYKCKKPYFGGKKSCELLLQEENQAKEDFNPKELVCANCCDLMPLENCQKHGKDYIEFKCKFCCNIAQWFCWGNTHFCDPCHQKQCNGDYVSKYSKDKLPKCPGKKDCVLKMDHKPNGEEFALGCSICRNMKDNSQKDF